MKNDLDQYRQWIIAAAQARSVPSDLALAVANEESWTQHYWQSGPHAGEVKISPKGAIGILQVEPYNAGGRNLYDPRQNIETGIGILAGLFTQFHSWPLAVAAYNAGAGRVSGWLKGINTLPRETLAYVRNITGQDFSGPNWTSTMARSTIPNPRPPADLSGRQLFGAGLLVAAVWLLLKVKHL